MLRKKKLGFPFSVLYLLFLYFDEDFTMPPEKNKVNNDRENQNYLIWFGVSFFPILTIYYNDIFFWFIFDLKFNLLFTLEI